MLSSQVLERPCSGTWTRMKKTIRVERIRPKTHGQGQSLVHSTHRDGLPQDKEEIVQQAL